MKKAISLLLILATLMGCMTGLISCTGGKGGDEEEVEKKKLNYTTDLLVDFNQASNITGNGLTVTTDTVKTATNGGVWNTSNKVTLPLSKTDLSSYKEISVWINNTSKSAIDVTFRLISDNGSTADTDSYGAKISVKPGWHQYNLPFSELTEDIENLICKAIMNVGEPAGINNISALVLDANNGNTSLVIDSVYAKTQKYGTLLGQDYKNLENAVCFVADSGTYLYNQLRYVMNETDRAVAVTEDNDTTYVPVEVLAAHKGATDIAASAEKVSFKYNGNAYEFTPNTAVEYVGHPDGKNAGRSLSSKPIVSGNYIMIPMEKCAEIFDYELYYDVMGLAIFSDTKDIYKSSDEQLDELYKLIEVIVFDNYDAEELLANNEELYEKGDTFILMNDADFARLKKLRETDANYAKWFKDLEAKFAKGTDNYNNNSFKYVLDDGRRLLYEARRVIAQVLPYSFLYKMTGNTDYSDKVYRILNLTTKYYDSKTSSPSWNPEHFLDTGELMYIFSLGYNWCYKAFTPEQRSVLEKGVWELGYGATMGFGQVHAFWGDPANHETVEDPSGSWFWQIKRGAPYQIEGVSENFNVFNFDRPVWSNNVNNVCNGGIIAMALAFAHVDGDFREASEYLIDCTLYTIPEGMKVCYAPDGGHPESPSYWGYSTEYSTVYIGSIMSACGTDLGISDAPGFKDSFYYINYVSSNNGWWNYHDCTQATPDLTRLMWAASVFDDSNISGLAFNALLSGQFAGPKERDWAWFLMYYDPENINTDIQINTDICYYGMDTALFRSDWNSTPGFFAGIHGADNNESHGNLDIGNFILEFEGTDFFVDLGKDNYNLVPPFNSVGDSVWTMWIYKHRAEGQNTLVINPSKVDTTVSSNAYQGRNLDQIREAYSQIQKYASGESSAYAVVDMGCAYLDATSGVRGMYITEDRSTVVIQDEISLKKANNEVYWMGHLYADAKIEISEDGQTAIIKRNGVTLVASIVLPKGYTGTFKFQTMTADYLVQTGLTTSPGEHDRSGYQKLVAYSSNCPSNLKLAVVFRLMNNGTHNYEWTPIDEWVAE